MEEVQVVRKQISGTPMPSDEPEQRGASGQGEKRLTATRSGSSDVKREKSTDSHGSDQEKLPSESNRNCMEDLTIKKNENATISRSGPAVDSRDKVTSVCVASEVQYYNIKK